MDRGHSRLDQFGHQHSSEAYRRQTQMDRGHSQLVTAKSHRLTDKDGIMFCSPPTLQEDSTRLWWQFYYCENKGYELKPVEFPMWLDADANKASLVLTAVCNVPCSLQYLVIVTKIMHSAIFSNVKNMWTLNVHRQMCYMRVAGVKCSSVSVCLFVCMTETKLHACCSNYSHQTCQW